MAQTRAAGWQIDDHGDVRVPAQSVALHIAKRTGVSADVAHTLWRSVYESLARRAAPECLFAGLDVDVSSDGAVEVRLGED